MGRFAVLDAVAIADCAMEIEGSDLDDLFETAARAVAELMVDPATVVPTVERMLTLTAPSLDLLFYDWLSELIYLKDSEQLVFTRARVEVQQDSPARLAARLTGGAIRAASTALRADPKAVTFHQFSIEPRGTGWRARVIIDI